MACQYLQRHCFTSNRDRQRLWPLFNNGGSGLVVLSYGLITLNNLDAENNGQNNFLGSTTDPQTGWGVYLDNCYFDWGLGTPACTSTGAPKGITLNGTNIFNGNYQDGLWATSLGPISVRQIDAEGNGGDGAYLDNQWAGAVGGITMPVSTATSWNCLLYTSPSPRDCS